jgi:transposase
LDIHQKTVVAGVLVSDPDGAVQRFVRTVGTMTADVLALGAGLELHAVTQVAMASTGGLWRPICNVLAEGHPLILVNAQHIQAVPGRKTDVKDSEWLGDRLRHGRLRHGRLRHGRLRHGRLRPSFIPPPPIGVRRDLTRSRTSLVEVRTQQINRIHPVRDTANRKRGTLASTVVGVSGRRMLRAREAGESDSAAWAEWAKGRLREKRLAWRQALSGRVQPHQRQLLLLGEALDHIEYLEPAIHRMEGRLAALVSEQERAVPLLLTVPATGPVTAAPILAEIGADMTRFPSAQHLACWAGVCPGNRRSAGQPLSGASTQGTAQLKTIRCEIAACVARSPGT